MKTNVVTPWHVLAIVLLSRSRFPKLPENTSWLSGSHSEVFVRRLFETLHSLRTHGLPDGAHGTVGFIVDADPVAEKILRYLEIRSITDTTDLRDFLTPGNEQTPGDQHVTVEMLKDIVTYWYYLQICTIGELVTSLGSGMGVLPLPELSAQHDAHERLTSQLFPSCHWELMSILALIERTSGNLIAPQISYIQKGFGAMQNSGHPLVRVIGDEALNSVGFNERVLV